MSDLKAILKTYSVVELKRFISKTNIKGYSKMKKDDIMELMAKDEHKDKFRDIKAKPAKPKPEPKKKEPKKKEPKPEPKKQEPKKEEPLPKAPKVEPGMKPFQTIVKELLKYDRGDPVNFTCYFGMEWFLYLYLLQKHKNDCVWDEDVRNEKYLSLPVSEQRYNLFGMKGGKVGVNLPSLKDKDTKKKIAQKYIECAKRNKLLVIPLQLKQHANMLVFNHKLKQVERYEPHGVGTQGKIQKGLDNALTKLAELIAKDKTAPQFTQGFRFSPSAESCPVFPKDFWGFIEEGAGLQAYDGTKFQREQKIKLNGDIIKDPEGFCCMWSYLQMDYRLSNPTLKPNELGTALMEQFKKKPKIAFRRFIRGYTSDFLDYLTKNLGGETVLTKLYKGNIAEYNQRFKSLVKRMYIDAGGKFK